MYNEADTRAKLIDHKLHASGWDEERIKREHYFTKGQIYLVGDKARRKQPLKADYLLRYNAALPLAVVEAKEEGLAPAAGLQQAKTYAQQLGLLFAYSTNGHGIEEFDFSTQVQRSLAAFPSPEELYQRYSAANRPVTGGLAAETRQPYLDPLVVPYYTADGRQPRYYQEIAINKAVQAISRGQRRVLLTMATGTGKTYVTTLPALAGSFCSLQRPQFQQELLRLRSLQPATLTPEGSIQAQWSGPCPPERAAPLPVFLPIREEVVNAIPTAEHLSRPTPAGKRDRFYLPALPALPAEPREPIIHGKVLPCGTTKVWVGQAARA